MFESPTGCQRLSHDLSLY